MGKKIEYDALLHALKWPALMTGAIAVSFSPAASAQSSCKGEFHAPADPMVLSRQVHRSLADGKELVVTRHYRVNFRPNTKGYLIEGEWLSTDVDAPPRLANLAALEKARATTTIFPIQLDHAGMIMSRENHRSPALNENEAQAARQLIDGAELKPAAEHQAIEFLDQVAKQTGPVISHWPASLFRPGPFNSEIQRELPPTNGESGMAIISISAQSTKPCSLMKKLERKVKTVIGGQMRETREIWTLDPAKD